MIEYTDSLGKLYGIAGLILTLLLPVIINRLLRVKYPLAIVTLLAFYLIGVAVDRLMFNLLFVVEPTVGALDGLFALLVPVYGYLMVLILDTVAYLVIKRRVSTKVGAGL